MVVAKCEAVLGVCMVRMTVGSSWGCAWLQGMQLYKYDGN
jgi:hypothetical protein